jgi:predicted alpha/beta hydrolase family esterase
MKKRVLINHTWDSNRPDAKWLFWLRKELEKRGIETTIQALDKQTFQKEWLADVKTTYTIADEHIFTIQHDPGCLTILRYLEYLQKNNITDTHLLVAGTPTQAGIGSYIRLESPKEIIIYNNEAEGPRPPLASLAAHMVVLYSASPDELPGAELLKLKRASKSFLPFR